jgi:hypothetical protein
MPKVVPFAPKEWPLTRDLDEVIQGHMHRLARFQKDRETPVASEEAEHLIIYRSVQPG